MRFSEWVVLVLGVITVLIAAIAQNNSITGALMFAWMLYSIILTIWGDD